MCLEGQLGVLFQRVVHRPLVAEEHQRQTVTVLNGLPIAFPVEGPRVEVKLKVKPATRATIAEFA